MSVNCHAGEGLRAMMPNWPPWKCRSSALLATSCTPANPEPIEKVYVAEKRMLCCMKANGDRTRVAGADFEVDVADGEVETTRVGVRNCGWEARLPAV